MFPQSTRVILNGIPFFGSVLFAILYFAAAWQYPGGSQADLQEQGFSWLHNYWCNLLSEWAMNGQPNTGRPFAIAGMAVICISLMVLWFVISAEAPVGFATRTVTRISGTLSVIIAIFLSSAYHDWVTALSGLSGVFALTGTLICLRRLHWRALLWLGLFNLFLVAVNNILYYGNGGLRYLPLVQKGTFLSFLIWISAISWQCSRRANSAKSSQERSESR